VSAGPRLPHFALVKLLAEAASLEHATPQLIELIADAFGWSAGALWLADAEDRVLVWSDGWTAGGDLEEFAARSRRLTFPRGVGLPGRVWADGEPAWIADLTEDPNLPRADLAAALGLRAGAGIPVYGDAGVLGAMEFFGRTPREPDAEALEATRTAGRQLGQYLERRRAERRLREAEAHAASIVRGALDCIVLMDATGVIRDFNPAAEATFGHARADVVGRELASVLIPERLRAAHRAAVARCVAGGHGRILDRRTELPALRADGTELPIELAVTRLPGGLFAGWLRDVSERRAAERERERRLAAERHARLAAEAAERSARHVAEALQRGLLPPSVAEPPGVDLAVVYRSGGEDGEVGGDFYDVFTVGEDRHALVIGDIRGKGVEAAALSGLARQTLRAAARSGTGGDPHAVLGTLNEALLRDRPARDFCTAAYGLLTGEGDLTLTLAGHPPPVLLRAGGTVEPVGRPGTLLGAIEQPELHPVTLRLDAGDALVLYTDGLTELRTPSGRLGADGLAVALAGCAGAAARTIADTLVARTLDAPGHRSGDDVALLVLTA
jgi:PAS domain S-box-containing protein